MEYFKMHQNLEYSEAPILPDVFVKINPRWVNPEKAHKIPDVTSFQLSNREKPHFIDLLDQQIVVVSEQFKKLVDIYVPKLLYKRIILTNLTRNLHKMYYLPIFTPIDCLSSESKLTPDKRAVTQIVLRSEAVRNLPLFRVYHPQQTMIIARLDFAESVLRRNFTGIKFDRIKLAQQGDCHEL